MRKSSRIKYPDYQNCITNLTASILNNYGVNNLKRPLPDIVAKLKDRRHIILFVLDGFGYNLFEKYRDNSLYFLKDQPSQRLTSVFPPTTSAAITSYLSGLNPIEHGALGWTLFFKEFARYIDFLPNWDSITKETFDQENYQTLKIISQENIFSRIKESNPDMELLYFTPDYIHDSAYTLDNSHPARIIPYLDIDDLFTKLQSCLLKSTKPHFIYVYSVNPDSLEHRFGVYSREVKIFLERLNESLINFSTGIAGTDTTMLLTADHGLTDIRNYKYTNDDEEFNDCLILPVFPEPRFASLFVKEHKKNKFKEVISHYNDKFILYERKDFLDSGLLGRGTAHRKIDDFIGNYLLIATDDVALKSIYEQNGRPEQEFKAHHAGLTSDEMDIPLITIDF